jgi:hypothetical protein
MGFDSTGNREEGAVIDADETTAQATNQRTMPVLRTIPL